MIPKNIADEDISILNESNNVFCKGCKEVCYADIDDTTPFDEVLCPHCGINSLWWIV